MIAGYVRCSTTRQDVASQRHVLTRYAKTQKLSSIRWFEDYSTGRNIKRRGLAALLAAVRAGEIETILVTDMSRMSRSVADACALITELIERRVKLVCINQGFTLEPSPLNVAMIQIMSVLAELEVSIRSSRIKNGLALARSRGQRLGRKPNVRKRARARILRQKGLSLQEIAEQMKCSPQNVSYLLKVSA